MKLACLKSPINSCTVFELKNTFPLLLSLLVLPFVDEELIIIVIDAVTMTKFGLCIEPSFVFLDRRESTSGLWPPLGIVLVSLVS